MVTAGGEVDFITKMIDESLVLKERCQWYTTMLGKFGSLEEVISRLKTRGGANWAVGEFIQAGKTRRWGVAWSWGNRRPPKVILFARRVRPELKGNIEGGKRHLVWFSRTEALLILSARVPIPRERSVSQGSSAEGRFTHALVGPPVDASSNSFGNWYCEWQRLVSCSEEKKAKNEG